MSNPKHNNFNNDGSELEHNTLELMRLFPGASVEQQKLLVGKKVDIFCILSNNFMPDFRVAIECKDWKRPLTRESAAAIISEYLPLLDQHSIDQFLLVTKNGLVAHAKELFWARFKAG